MKKNPEPEYFKPTFELTPTPGTIRVILTSFTTFLGNSLQISALTKHTRKESTQKRHYKRYEDLPFHSIMLVLPPSKFEAAPDVAEVLTFEEDQQNPNPK